MFYFLVTLCWFFSLWNGAAVDCQGSNFCWRIRSEIWIIQSKLQFISFSLPLFISFVTLVFCDLYDVRSSSCMPFSSLIYSISLNSIYPIVWFFCFFLPKYCRVGEKVLKLWAAVQFGLNTYQSCVITLYRMYNVFQSKESGKSVL